MEVFIVRPFGNRPVLKKDKASGNFVTVMFDFDKVEKELMAPALTATNLKGGTTGEIHTPGSIHEDMFSLLLQADIVIADITIHNANVFYELGIRHSLRDRKTILLKCPGYDDTPFDISGFRYLEYDITDPAKMVDQLILTLNETIETDRPDSPVFKMLPRLESQDPERFLAVPADFMEEVELARAGRQLGKLALLAYEASGFPWGIPAFRSVAGVLYEFNEFESAGLLWEKVRKKITEDTEANSLLATIYQRLSEAAMTGDNSSGWELLAKSEQAIDRLLLKAEKFDKNKRAEIYSLKARNTKTKWVYSWKNAADTERKQKALQSGYLVKAYEEYERAYKEDLNHFYSGINALSLLTIIISLADALPDSWKMEFDTDDEGAEALKKHKVRQQQLSILVQASIEAAKARTQQNEKVKLWLNITEADLACLTITKPLRVGALYQKIVQEANNLNFDAAKRQLLLYQQLNIQPDNVKAGLVAFNNTENSEERERVHFLLFIGHLIDKPDRPEPRFTPEKEAAVTAAIRDEVTKEKQKIPGRIKGIAGGACGSDILFHEVCIDLGIETELYLALPRALYIVESVGFAGSQWIERFDRLYQKLARRILSPTKELPNWLAKKKGYSIWERNNLWMLNSCLVRSGFNMTLVALWDGEGGDKQGGTLHMIKEAESRGTKIIVIDINKIV